MLLSLLIFASLPFASLPSVSGQDLEPDEEAPKTGFDLETLTVIRHADLVSILSGKGPSPTTGRRQERILYYWDKRADMATGDEMRQGSGAVSEVSFSGVRMRLFGPASVIPRGILEGVRSLECREISRGLFEIGSEPLRVSFPGGHAIEGMNAQFQVERRDVNKELVIRNAGPGTLTLSGVVRESGATLLPKGHRIVIPVLPAEERNPRGPRKSDWLEGLRVLTGEAIQVNRTARGLFLQTEGLYPGIADIGGARIVVAPQSGIHFARVRPPDNLSY